MEDTARVSIARYRSEQRGPQAWLRQHVPFLLSKDQPHTERKCVDSGFGWICRRMLAGAWPQLPGLQHWALRRYPAAGAAEYLQARARPCHSEQLDSQHHHSWSFPDACSNSCHRQTNSQAIRAALTRRPLVLHKSDCQMQIEIQQICFGQPCCRQQSLSRQHPGHCIIGKTPRCYPRNKDCRLYSLYIYISS